MSPEAERALLFGSVATTIVSLLSLSGACLIPLVTGKTRHRCMHFFVAMAVSTLSSDAILHILPQLLEADGHDHGHDHHHHHHHPNCNNPASNDTKIDEDHNDENHGVGLWTVTRERWMLLRLSVVMLTIFFIYFMEFVAYYRKKEERWNRESFLLTKSKITRCSETLTNHAWEEQPSDGNSEELLTTTPSNAENSLEQSVEEDANFCCGLKSRALVILLGDGVHNLIDGIAIGASFHHSLHLGVITTIAVICHEVPHELGDLAVLLESGLSMRTALALNLLSALTSFIGLIVSIIAGETNEVQMWLLAITAGMFIYVAWIDMLAHLKHDGSHKDHWILACLIQYSGFSVGFVTIFALGWFEENLFSS